MVRSAMASMTEAGNGFPRGRGACRRTCFLPLNAVQPVARAVQYVKNVNHLELVGFVQQREIAFEYVGDVFFACRKDGEAAAPWPLPSTGVTAA